MRHRRLFASSMVLTATVLAGCAADLQGPARSQSDSMPKAMNAGQSAERIGGQAGLQAPVERRTIEADSLGGVRVGGQAGLQAPVDRRMIGADSLGGMRVGGQAGLQTPEERRTIGDDSLGGVRMGSRAGLESDPEKPDSEAK